MEGLGLSLDGSTAERHDSIRGVPGTFDRTMQAIRWAQELEMPLQVNTLVAAETADDIPAIYELLKPFAVSRWSLFFLISVGRGKVLQPLSPEDGEGLMGWIYETSLIAPFTVATTEAPSYRRVALERMRASGLTGERNQAKRRLPRVWHTRRARHHVRLEHRRHLPGRFPAAGGGKCPLGSRRWTSIATRRLFNRCTTQRSSKDGAATANTTRCAADRAPGPTKPRETRWPRIPSVLTNPGTAASALRPSRRWNRGFARNSKLADNQLI